MNDKNFIEELRQKREEYGVTQRKLAVACGISRTYFNQIENGTVVPSAELKQTIEKQIERFNPQEPLLYITVKMYPCSGGTDTVSPGL